MKIVSYLVLLFLLAIPASAQEQFNLKSIPFPLSWHNTPKSFQVTEDGSLVITGNKSSRLFNDPQRISPPTDTAPIALFKPDEQFVLSCKVKVDFGSKFDAGVLMVYANPEQWAKLCYEYSPQGEPMVVSVVNNVVSDDSNNAILQKNEVYMCIAGYGGGVYAFQYSADGNSWNMARYFYLNPQNDLKIGFLSQSPNGEQCKSTFSDIRYIPKKLEELRGNDEMITKRISSIPHNLIIHNRPVDYTIEKDRISITAAGKTNLFNSPSGKSKVVNAPLVLFEPEGDFTISAKVTGKLKSIYDVAALVVYQDDGCWAKFCYENSVNLKPTIVSVVTRGFSDDCNFMPTGDYAYMAVVKKGPEYSFFYSSDNKDWLMVRNFNLETKGKIKVGFGAHGSRGDGFTGIFSEIKYQPQALDDMRMLSQ